MRTSAMKPPLIYLLLLLGTFACRSAKAASVEDIVPQNCPKSEFNDSIDFGKDPFFPRSGRRPKVAIKNTDTETIRPNVPDHIVLKGISVLKDKRLAIINNYTLGEGEEFLLKNAGQAFKVKCVEIKERSAIISVNGATKELPMRSGF
jgi:hypothetical protein